MRVILAVLSIFLVPLAYAEVAAGTAEDPYSKILSEEGVTPDMIEQVTDTRFASLDTLDTFQVDKWLSEQSIIKMYQYSIDKRGCYQPAMEPWQATEELSKEGIEVIHSERGVDGLIRPIQNLGCINELPAINIVTVSVTDYEAMKKKGFELCEELKRQGGYCYSLSYSEMQEGNRDKYFVHVYKLSNKIQCEESSGIDVRTMEQDLVTAKIVVYQRYEAVDGLSYPVGCGKAMGSINVYVIEKSRLGDSLSKGFRECAWLKQQGGSCYPVLK